MRLFLDTSFGKAAICERSTDNCLSPLLVVTRLTRTVLPTGAGLDQQGKVVRGVFRADNIFLKRVEDGSNFDQFCSVSLPCKVPPWRQGGVCSCSGDVPREPARRAQIIFSAIVAKGHVWALFRGVVVREQGIHQCGKQSQYDRGMAPPSNVAAGWDATDVARGIVTAQVASQARSGYRDYGSGARRTFIQILANILRDYGSVDVVESTGPLSRRDTRRNRASRSTIAWPIRAQLNGVEYQDLSLMSAQRLRPPHRPAIGMDGTGLCALERQEWTCATALCTRGTSAGAHLIRSQFSRRMALAVGTATQVWGARGLDAGRHAVDRNCQTSKIACRTYQNAKPPSKLLVLPQDEERMPGAFGPDEPVGASALASRGPRRTEYVSQMGIKRKRNLKRSDGHGRVGHSEVKAGVKDETTPRASRATHGVVTTAAQNLNTEAGAASRHALTRFTCCDEDEEDEGWTDLAHPVHLQPPSMFSSPALAHRERVTQAPRRMPYPLRVLYCFHYRPLPKPNLVLSPVPGRSKRENALMHQIMHWPPAHEALLIRPSRSATSAPPEAYGRKCKAGRAVTESRQCAPERRGCARTSPVRLRSVEHTVPMAAASSVRPAKNISGEALAVQVLAVTTEGIVLSFRFVGHRPLYVCFGGGVGVGSSLFPSFLSREDHDPEPAPTIQGAAWGLISASMEAPSCSAPAFLLPVTARCANHEPQERPWTRKGSGAGSNREATKFKIGYKYERASARAAGMGSLRGGYYTIEFRICPDREQQLGIPNWVTTLPEVSMRVFRIGDHCCRTILPAPRPPAAAAGARGPRPEDPSPTGDAPRGRRRESCGDMISPGSCIRYRAASQECEAGAWSWGRASGGTRMAAGGAAATLFFQVPRAAWGMWTAAGRMWTQMRLISEAAGAKHGSPRECISLQARDDT
ncbi:hypothetical protein C8Q70DRAFT_936287 [Cubamyces menziesii]|nr:hypothetical protein C8Q70DRAFT_936287 [Cubamyces menziesii]